jgi:hypothetical protein
MNPYEQDAPKAEDLTQTALEAIATKLNRLTILANKMALIEATLKETEDELKQLEEKELPAELEKFGVSEVKMADGRTLSIKEIFHCYISEARQEAAYEWMEENGFGSLIKNKLLIETNKDDMESMVSFLEDHGIRFSIERSIHHSTLKSFVNTQMTAPAEDDPIRPPLDLFGIHPSKKAEVKDPNNKKQKRIYERKK